MAGKWLDILLSKTSCSYKLQDLNSSWNKNLTSSEDADKYLKGREECYCQIFYDSSTDKVHFIKEIII